MAGCLLSVRSPTLPLEFLFSCRKEWTKGGAGAALRIRRPSATQSSSAVLGLHGSLAETGVAHPLWTQRSRRATFQYLAYRLSAVQEPGAPRLFPVLQVTKPR